ncbi:acyloxyacyl hydrolase [Fulvivirga sp. 29W222]|uniref:Acyloxyacyl hydrolase n=1 Tax=Fulvivirga marina TaxID=2494733 RepID=A0A937FWI3_9BACT|nr:acyloxyacyl hydrolase [Fulvivirga marina]MBL6447460.1 acyloxyacyl hydrolase [Fulvivirga marina]
MRYLLTIVIAALFFNQNLFAQQKPSWSFGVNTHYGGVLRYKEDMPKLQMSNLYGLELYAAKITNGNRRWEKLFNYPHVGFAASYFNYGLPQELGSVYSLASYLDVTTNNHRKNQWRLNIGTGFVYSTRTFEASTNPENKAISSKISYVLRGTVHHEIKISDQYYFNINLAFRHYSNGKLNMPNNGMNFPIAGIGLRYVPNPQKIRFEKDTLKSIDRKWHINIFGGTAWREVLREDTKHKAYSASLYTSRQITKYNTILLGMDGFLYSDESVKKSWAVYNEQHGIAESTLEDDGRQLALTVGSELMLGKMMVILQGGFYVYKPQDYYASSWYQRYGFKYKLAPNFFPQVTLKAHSRTADMVEFGLGLSI